MLNLDTNWRSVVSSLL